MALILAMFLFLVGISVFDSQTASAQAPSTQRGCATKRAEEKWRGVTRLYTVASVELRVRYCWRNGRITEAAATSRFIPTDLGLKLVRGPKVDVDRRPGDRSRKFTATLTYDTCLPGIGCLGQKTLQVEIVVYGDGSWLWEGRGGNGREATDDVPPRRRSQDGGR